MSWRVVYADQFLVAADVALQTHNPNWSKWLGGGTNFNLVAASDDLRPTAIGVSLAYRYLGENSPRVNQRISANWYTTGLDEICGFVLRANGTDAYVLTANGGQPTTLLHYNGGAFDTLHTFGFNAPSSTLFAMSVEVVGTSPVRVRVRQGSNDETHYETGILLTAGECGPNAFANVSVNNVRIDDLQIEGWFPDAPLSLAPQQRIS